MLHTKHLIFISILSLSCWNTIMRLMMMMKMTMQVLLMGSHTIGRVAVISNLFVRAALNALVYRMK